MAYFCEEDITLLHDQRKKDEYSDLDKNKIKDCLNRLWRLGENVSNDSSIRMEKARNIPFNYNIHVYNIWFRLYFTDYAYCKDYLFFTIGIFSPNGELENDKYVFRIAIDYKYTSKFTPTDELKNKIVVEDIPYQDFIQLNEADITDKIKKFISDNKQLFVEIASTFDSEFIVWQAKKLLEDRKNIILTGAPGTGKTYLAQMIARAMGSKATKLVQFHPSYDYTDFIEGLRPFNSEGTSGTLFRRQDGVFKKFCKLVVKDTDPNSKYVFIIDEINRGELSKIFGELFYSVDKGYRGKKGKVETQYQNLVDFERDSNGIILLDEKENQIEDVFKEGFYVPEKIYIIGTMNDIDRSIEPMDFAVRRRFAWMNIAPEMRVAMWGNVQWSSEARIKMNNVNSLIRAIEELGDPYCIGPAYFLDPPMDNSNVDWDELWTSRFEILIKEYLRGLQDADEYFKLIFKAYNADNDITDQGKINELDKLKNKLK